MSAAGAPFFGVVYADQYGSIQNAIAAAGSNGSVVIPATYSGTDIYVNPLGISIMDLRPGKLAFNAATGAAARPPSGMWPYFAVLPSNYGSSSAKSVYATGQTTGPLGAFSSGPQGQ